MCTGKELSSPSPSKAHYQLDMAHYPQVNKIEVAISNILSNIDFSLHLFNSISGS